MSAIFIFSVAVILSSFWKELYISYHLGSNSSHLFSSSRLPKFGSNLTFSSHNHITASVPQCIFFMSCNRENMKNPFWTLISKSNSLGYILMGDNIYGDSAALRKSIFLGILKAFILHPIRTFYSVFHRTENFFSPTSPDILEASYKNLQSNLEFQSIFQLPSFKFIVGTWDDHDYGINDGDKTYIYKNESKKLFLDFFNASKDDPRRAIDYQGVYNVKYIDLPVFGLNQSLNVSIICLDARFNKDPWSYEPTLGDFLGTQQWEWLTFILSDSKADVHLIISSIQVLQKHRKITESWDKFPTARKRLLNLILRKKTRNVFFLSGDVHFSEITSTLCVPLNQKTNTTYAFTIILWEITSSSLTHSIGLLPYGFGFLLDFYFRWINRSDQVKAKPFGTHMFSGLNIGSLHARWNQKSKAITLKYEVLDQAGRVVLNNEFLLSSLHKIWAQKTFHNFYTHQDDSLLNNASFWSSLDWNCASKDDPSYAPAHMRSNIYFLLSFVLIIYSPVFICILISSLRIIIIKLRKRTLAKQQPIKSDV